MYLVSESPCSSLLRTVVVAAKPFSIKAWDVPLIRIVLNRDYGTPYYNNCQGLFVKGGASQH